MDYLHWTERRQIYQTIEVFLVKVNIFEEGESLIEKEDEITKIPFKVFVGTDYDIIKDIV